MGLDFDVVDLPPADHPEPGEQAPDFERPLVNDEYWEDRALSELIDEGPVLLLFHPMDGAFPATYLWNEVRDRGWGAREDDHRESSERSSGDDGAASREADGDLQVVGVSISSPYEHKTLIADREIADRNYRLFSDPDAGVAERYGIAHDLDGMTGITEPRPAVFLLDGERVVQYAWVAEHWPQFPDYDDVEAALDEF
ncbi:MAG: redoxin domain-containing protein [Haloarculaceae archaeon]